MKNFGTPANPVVIMAELAKTLRLGIAIVEEEREIMVSSYKERDGKVRDAGALRDIRRYDRFLRSARRMLE